MFVPNFQWEELHNRGIIRILDLGADKPVSLVESLYQDSNAIIISMGLVLEGSNQRASDRLSFQHIGIKSGLKRSGEFRDGCG
ncbi:hypothetical protein MFMK1_001942 [Metallumcola ferriviriculae]|uniref:Uncharacterized protein n=1 Tax=Metallumcola ferriviriculae TaxID=3039180 RepID=A0AAU0UL81_9FIRM|nr:hypothetical protein MFMK1_001942 [Desulfitibacteraceae bacterium MK1]